MPTKNLKSKSKSKPKSNSKGKPKRKSKSNQPSHESGFAELALSETALAAVEKAGYETPTPIQSAVIPRALEGLDLVGQARTGTGKTAAFLLPIIEQVNYDESQKLPQAVVLVPTRELATQVCEEAVKLSRGRSLRVVVLCGGKPFKPQLRQLQEGVDLVIGTPGRVLDHMRRKTLVLDKIRFAVLDEADRMLDIGFRPDIEKILRQCPRKRQTLLLSATVPPPVERIAKQYMNDPETLNFSSGDVSVDSIDLYYITVDQRKKFEVLVELLSKEKPEQAIVFCRTKRTTDRVARKLKDRLKDVSAMHGDMPQRARDRVMKKFREGQLRCLVATDVIGRGIDVSGISHIINYDIPEFCDDYVHRVGRTGRMGSSGVAYTLVTPEEGPQLTNIEMRINRLLKQVEMDGFSRERKSAAPEADSQGDKKEKKDNKMSPSSRRKKRYRRAL